MPSRYYIRPHESNLGPQLMNMGVQLYGLKQRGELAREQMALSEKELGMKGQQLSEEQRINALKYGTPGTEADAWNVGSPATPGLEQQKIGLAGRQVDVDVERNRLAAQKAKEEGAVDRKQFNFADAAFAINHFKKLGISEDYPIIQKIKEMSANPEVTKGAAYQELLRDYPSYREEMGMKIADKFVKENEKNPMHDKTPEGKAQLQMIEDLTTDKTGEKVLGGYFKETIASMQAREAGRLKTEAEAIKAIRVNPSSDIGKLENDKQTLIAQGYPPDSPVIKAFDAEIKKKSEATPPKVQSMGNAVDLAINKKFQDPSYLTDPDKQKEALVWLGTPEGKQAVRDAAQDVTPPQITYLQTSEGLVPAITKGAGVGKVGEPTGLNKPISPEQASKIGDLNTLLTNLEATKKLYKPSWVGPVAGRVGGLQEKYTGGASEDQVKFYAYVRDMKDALLRARSGAQINEQEYARLVKFLPDETSPPKTFEARIERFKESLHTILSTKKQALGEAGYGVGKKSTGKKIGRYTVEVE